MHKSYNELQTEIDRVSNEIQIGSQYVHYKSSERLYEIIGYTIIEETDEVGIIYMPLDQDEDTNVSFVRPHSSFVSKVDYEGKQVSRFELKE